MSAVKRLVATSLITAVTFHGSFSWADSNYLIGPEGAGELGNILGADFLKSASTYIDTLEKEWKVPVVRPEYDAQKKLTNLEDMIPHELRIVPNVLTISTSKYQGTLAEYRRARRDNVYGTVVQPSEASVFVYALNKKGQLIYPLIPNPHGDGMVSTYDLLLTGNHFNRGNFSQPIVAAQEVDAAGGTGVYNPNKPGVNPPYAVMVRARTAGQYSVLVNGRPSPSLLSGDMKEEEKKRILNQVSTATFSVNAVDGVDLIDAVALSVTEPKAKSSSSGKDVYDGASALMIKLQPDASREISLTGRNALLQWNDAKGQYVANGYTVSTLRHMTWTYRNDPPNEAHTELVTITPLNADGTHVRLTGRKLAAPGAPTKGIILIEGHGRRFKVGISVSP